MSAEPLPIGAERPAGDTAFAPRALHAVPDEARLLPADLLYGRLLATAAQHAAGGGPPHQGRLRRADGRVAPLPLAQWLGPIDAADAELLERVEGSALDIGCGPGRHVAALREAGHPGLGIDLSPVAVEITRGRGADAILGSVFEHVPDAGGWGSALLLDGNIGIGGEPASLLCRARELLAPGGAVLAELDPPGAWSGVTRVRLEAPGIVSEWFPWAQVGVDTVEQVAAEAGLARDWTMCSGGRWFTALRRP
jgi:SAM-dependent methyltransferase